MMGWEKITHSGKHHAIFFMDTVFQGYKSKVIGDFFEIDFNPTHYRQFGGARWWFREEVTQYIAALKRKEENNQGFLLHKAEEYETLNKKFWEWSCSFRKHDFSPLSNQEIKSIFSVFIQHLTQINALVYTSIFLDRFYTDEIVRIITKKEKNFEKQRQLLNAIFQIEWGLQSHLKKEALLHLAERGITEKKISEFLLNFSHLNLIAFHGKIDVPNDILQEIKTLKVEKEKIQIAELKTQKIEKTLEPLRLSPSEQLKIKTLRKWAFVANNDDHYVMGSIACFWKLWHEIAGRLGITFEQFVSMTIGEVQIALEENSLSAEFKKSLTTRYNNSAMLWDGKDIQILVGENLERYSEQEKKSEEKFYSLKEIRGTPASKGHALGTVQILTDIQDLHKVKEGQILVAVYTYPAIVIAMEKAAAIVTDQGGLLSHAAIVSRELGKPCVVGTEIGTKVFHNGDVVEVDANEGIVRKIK